MNLEQLFSLKCVLGICSVVFLLLLELDRFFGAALAQLGGTMITSQLTLCPSNPSVC